MTTSYWMCSPERYELNKLWSKEEVMGRIRESIGIDSVNDMVNHPPHYKNHPSGVECIKITEHMNFCLGNVMKYIWRSDHKNGLEDLKKAKWYLDREIERREQDGS